MSCGSTSTRRPGPLRRRAEAHAARPGGARRPRVGRAPERNPASEACTSTSGSSRAGRSPRSAVRHWRSRVRSSAGRGGWRRPPGGRSSATAYSSTTTRTRETGRSPRCTRCGRCRRPGVVSPRRERGRRVRTRGIDDRLRARSVPTRGGSRGRDRRQGGHPRLAARACPPGRGGGAGGCAVAPPLPETAGAAGYALEGEEGQGEPVHRLDPPPVV